MNYTKGEWTVTKHGTPDYAPQYGIYASESQNDHVIVKGDNAKADASLISAAPDMYEVLREVDNWLNGRLVFGGKDRLVKEVKNALTKAEGK